MGNIFQSYMDRVSWFILCDVTMQGWLVVWRWKTWRTIFWGLKWNIFNFYFSFRFFLKKKKAALVHNTNWHVWQQHNTFKMSKVLDFVFTPFNMGSFQFFYFLMFSLSSRQKNWNYIHGSCSYIERIECWAK